MITKSFEEYRIRKEEYQAAKKYLEEMNNLRKVEEWEINTFGEINTEEWFR
jgi:hypothetical protein